LFVIWPINDKISHYYPLGADSWCRFDRDIANRTKWFKPIPGQPVDLPINPRLSENAFLARHLDGKPEIKIKL